MYIYAMVNGSNIVIQFFTETNLLSPEEFPDCILVDAIDETWVGRKRWNAETQTWEDVLPSESTGSNSLEFTHIDSDGTKHWLDVFVNDLAAKIELGITQNTTNTITNTADTQSWAVETKYYPHLEMAFARIFCTTATNLEADTAYVIGTLADTSYAPEQTYPLSVMCGKEVQAYIGNSGNISIKPYETVYANTPVRVAGFWFRPEA